MTIGNYTVCEFCHHMIPRNESHDCPVANEAIRQWREKGMKAVKAKKKKSKLVDRFQETLKKIKRSAKKK